MRWDATQGQTFAMPLQVVARKMDRSLEMHSSLLSSGAMLSPRACATPEGSESAQRSEKSMHDMHRGRHPRCVVGANSTSQSQSIRSSVAALVRLSKALFIAYMLYVRRTAAGDALSVEYRVMNDADHALRCGHLCGHAGSWRSSSASGDG